MEEGSPALDARALRVAVIAAAPRRLCRLRDVPQVLELPRARAAPGAPQALPVPRRARQTDRRHALFIWISIIMYVRIAGTACKLAVYCSLKCQKKDWKQYHKTLCAPCKAVREHPKIEDAVAISAVVRWSSADPEWRPIGNKRSEVATLVTALEALTGLRDSSS